VQPQPIVPDAGEVSSPAQPQLDPEARGPGVLRAQILLDRAHFSCGQMDGVFGSNLQKTVTAFQQDRHLPLTGAIDVATWAALNADRAPALTNYSITPEDEKGPFVQVPSSMGAAGPVAIPGLPLTAR